MHETGLDMSMSFTYAPCQQMNLIAKPSRLYCRVWLEPQVFNRLQIILHLFVYKYQEI